MKEEKGSTNQNQGQSKISFLYILSFAENLNLHILWIADYPVDFPLMQTHFWESLIGHETAFSTNSRNRASCDLHLNV